MKNIPLEDVLQAVALSPNVVSRVPIFEKYDKNVQGNTFVERGQAAVSVILPFNDFPELTEAAQGVGVAVGTGGNPNVAKIDAQQAAEMAIAQAALKVACVGGEWLGATDCLNFGNPEKPAQMGEFVAGVNGVKKACVALEIPIVSGNVSLYNESDGKSIPPSALVSVFARVGDVAPIKPTHWKTQGAYIYRVGASSAALGGSEFNRLFELGSTELPALDYTEVQADAEALRVLVQNEEVEAIIPLQAGGVWGTLLGAAINSGQGFSLNLEENTVIADLLAETLGALVISQAKQPGLTLLGTTTKEMIAGISVENKKHEIDLNKISHEWQHQLRSIF